MPFLDKLVIGLLAGTIVSAPTAVYFYPPWSVELTKEKFQEFKKSKGFDSCYTFLSNKDKKYLLFLCLKPESGLPSGKTHGTYYYFYNGGSWEEAKSLGKNPNGQPKDVFLVRVNKWWGVGIREIKNSDEAQNKLEEINQKGMLCTFEHSKVKGNEQQGKGFSCFSGTQWALNWKLQNFE